MAAAVLPNVSVSGPFPMASHQRISNSKMLPTASSSRSKQPSSSSSSSAAAADFPTKPLNRLRSSLEQSIRTATRSKKQAPPVDDFATITHKTSKGKEREALQKDKEKHGMLRRLESKVNFRRGGRESVTPAPSPIPPAADETTHKVRLAGFASFVTPSLRQGSMSSPALPLSSQALPSPKSQPMIPASPTQVSPSRPARDRTRRSSNNHPSQISPPALTDGRSVSESKEPILRHKSTKSAPHNNSPSPSSQFVDLAARPPETPSKPRRDLSSPYDTPTPASGSRGQYSPKMPAQNSDSPSASTSTILPRNSSPIRARSPSTRNRVVLPSQRGLTSSSTSHLPTTQITGSSPTPRRPSVDSRRPSIDSPRRPSIDSPRRPSTGSPNLSREESPSPIRPRPVSPSQRTYSQNRHFNISSASLTSPSSDPAFRELIRSATTLLCKEVNKPPVHATRTEVGARDWEEVEVRMRALSRLERIWGKSGANGSSSNLSNVGALSSSGLSASGEERERRLFTEALRDGFVLCQLMNKLRSSSVVRPDPREDGLVRCSNITKFLAACSSYGLPDDDLFQRDDLIEASGESLTRVAKTIIALIKFVDAPIADPSKVLPGQTKKPSPAGPYTQGTTSRAASSSPNLYAQSSPSPTPSPVRKRWSPSSGLPTVRSDSPDEVSAPKSKTQQNKPIVDESDRSRDIAKVLTPPPRSPLRARSTKTVNEDEDGRGLFTCAVNLRSSVADSTRASIGDASVRDLVTSNHFIRHSTVSTMTDSSMATTGTMFSSLLDVGRATSSVLNKFGTIRTFTTEATSESPSISRAEGISIAEDLARKRTDSCSKYDRKLSDAAVIDLSRVIEETDESSASSRGNGRGKAKRATAELETETEENKPERGHALRLGKGKWPDDFLDVLQAHNQPSVPAKSSTSSDDADDRSYTPSPTSTSAPRKLAIVGSNRRNESVESLPQFPRRPTHRARHSIDSPVLLPREPSLRRDVSPDAPSSSKAILRRHSTKPAQRSGSLVPKNADESRGSDSDKMVPFPRTASGEHTPSISPHSSSGDGPSGSSDVPRPLRGRFQSDIEGSSRRRTRPSSYDELGAKPTRSRFESMVNLGVASSGNTSASDLLSRDSMEGSAVRKPLIIREEGKPPTHFQLGNCIGRGQFGSVYRALNLNTGQMVAVKRIRLEGLKEDEVTTLMREVDLVKRLSHPSIVKYEGMARDTDTLSIVLEYAENGSLGQTLKAFGKLNERLVASYVVKILEGLHYLHTSDVVHCDLKAANILTTKNGNVKLSDFGVSLNLRAMEREIKDVAGTPNWMAPEVIELKGASPKSDIWSLACTVIELLTGRPPYGDIANSMSVMFRIVEDDMPPIPDGCSALLEDFLRQCFNKDPAKRPGADLLCEHEWLKKNWGAHKASLLTSYELRPQDSIPFLRRVSADLQKSEAVRFLSQVEMPDTPPLGDHPHDDAVSGSPPRRHSNSSARPLADNDISPREHTFVKTTFSKPMTCRVCLLNVKKSAVLCSQCSLISHSKCARNAPPTCDLRAQLLLYAQYAEKGNPNSVYSNPADLLRDGHPTSPMSDVSYVAHTHTPRTSIDVPPATPNTSAGSQPTAFKFIEAFKRSRSNLTPDQDYSVAGSSTSSPDKASRTRGPALQRKITKERPQSFSSNSTVPNSSSLRSAPESAGRKSTFSTDTDGGTRSISPIEEGEVHSPSRIASASGFSDEGHFPGALVESRRHRKTKSAGNCIVQ
ncbi:STE/STE11/cdc15 protein kinase [Armillaria novae-zelandiae]|uniref:STE/STE11/cdc15 protein kinase n=1 Tax=Armillaria novae-zelandiae TaxID=153914 RepID=A0AA39PR23_9AGAR|nr:STE/STE11/cdc15 protein kinase [Armillaria novae-zelandiae]